MQHAVCAGDAAVVAARALQHGHEGLEGQLGLRPQKAPPRITANSVTKSNATHMH
jgi:hypothetical protein